MTEYKIDLQDRHARLTAMWILAVVVLFKIVAQYFAINPAFDLQRDEYLHLDQGNHLAWGYMSVPPLTSWISVLIKLLGNSVFWIKFFPALFGAYTIIAAFKISQAIGGGLYSATLTAVALLFSVLFRINILYQPNSFDILAWTVLYFFIIKYIGSLHSKWLFWAGITFALGFLNKYNILFLGLSLALALLLTPERKVYGKKNLYLTAAIALFLISPNLYWQYQNGFPVVHHMKELAETQLIHVSRRGFLIAQMLFFFQAIFIILAAFAGFIFYKPFKKYLFVFISYLICIALFTYFRAKDYYTLGLYPVLISFGAVYLEQLFRYGWKRYFKPISFIVVVGLFYPFLIRLPIVSPSKLIRNAPFNTTGPNKWEDGKEHGLSQDFADMLGWKELARKTDSVYKTLPPEEYSLVIADNYGQAGAINYYAGLKAVSMNADYINWFNFDRPIKNILIIKEKDKSEGLEAKALFKEFYVADSITDPFSLEQGTKIYVLKAALVPVNVLLNKKLMEEKKKEGLPD